MRTTLGGLGLLALAAGLLAGCGGHAPTQGPTMADGWSTYTESRLRGSIACGAEPVELRGNRSNVKLTGGCRQVRVAGDHNDVYVEIAPGGSIEITGSHNDVTWHQSEPGETPKLTVVGAKNDFHRAG